MKKFKKFLALLTIATLLPSTLVCAQPPEGETWSIGEPPELIEVTPPDYVGEVAPPICAVDADAGIKGYKEQGYMSLIDITSGRYFNTEATLEPHKIYALHTYMESSLPWRTEVESVYALPSEISADVEDSIRLVMMADENTVVGSEFLSVISTGQKLSIQPIVEKAIVTYGNDWLMSERTTVSAYETRERVLYFQTVAEGDEPIVIGNGVDEDGRIAGVPLLVPAGYPTVSMNLNHAMAGLPAIAGRSTWVEGPGILPDIVATGN